MLLNLAHSSLDVLPVLICLNGGIARLLNQRQTAPRSGGEDTSNGFFRQGNDRSRSSVDAYRIFSWPSLFTSLQ